MTIAEVAREYDVSADTLRYYERIGLIPAVGRNRSGIRDYKEEDCRWVEFTKCMRSAGIPIEALIEYVTLFQQGPKTRAARKQILIEQRDQLLAKMNDIQKSLDRLNEKIENYDANMAKTEAMLMMRKEH
ncbi:MerR family transcriptional regulator [Lachnotalea sp. AF33-28]|uniref:MerR family transcriptional regulator n=1 Tax=Lachnotalea sp. AF33-28 TaxID=2292046 RepID=UPI000E4958DE|nr:MerR family transcriptional regulator [Lachnotalea sp. AF33-28]RHP36117.1 MerR family transcriptional regulator [Lachnotalea sp. AF33-28]